MPLQLAKVLRPPAFSDPDERRIAKTLHTVIISVLIGAFLYLPVLIVSPDISVSRWLFILGAIGIQFFVLYILHRGHINVIRFALPISLWLIFTVSVLSSGGVRGPGFTGYIVVILITGMTIHWRAALFATGLSILIGLVALIAESSGLLIVREYTSLGVWLATSVVFLISVVITRQSIEDLIQTRMQLRTQEISFRTLVENSPDFILRFDKKLRHIYVNPSLLHFVGLPFEAIVGKTNRELGLPPENDRLWEESLTKVFQTGEGLTMNFDFHAETGHMYFHATLSPEFAKDGTVETVMAVVRNITEITQAQEQVTIQSLALEHGLNGFDIVDEQGRFVYVNQAYITMWGYDSAEEVLTTLPVDHCADPESAKTIIRNTLKYGKYTHEYLAKRKDGSTFDVLMSINSFKTPSGKTLFIGTSEDITERNRAKKQLEIQQQRETIIGKASQALTQTLDLDTIMKTLLTYLKMLVPYDSGNVMFVEGDNSITVADIVGYDDYASDAEVKAVTFILEDTPAINQVVKGRESFRIADTRTFEGWIRPDVSRHVISWMGIPLIIDDKVIGLFSVDKSTPDFFTADHQSVAETLASFGATGISNARLHAEIVHERNRLRTLIDNIPDYIFIKDREGRFIETNAAHAAAANLTRDDLLNRKAADVFEPGLAMQFHEDDNEVLESGTPIINEERVSQNVNGDRRWVLTTKVPLFDETGEVMGLVGISRDITERRIAEADRLEAERLRIEIEQTRDVVDLKQRFIQTASHEFRTPLAIIKSSAGLLQDYFDRFSEERRLVKLHQIQEQVDHMVHLIDEVLVISRANDGELTLSPKLIDVKRLCERIWEDMNAIDGVKHTGDFRYETDITEIVADQQLLEYALVNLLSNAFKYTPDDALIRFHVSQGANNLIFKVSDSGRGIPESDQDRIFQAFFRARNAAGASGTGLGLAITKTYVELHGGTIDFESTEGEGTTFTICLPLKSPQE